MAVLCVLLAAACCFDYRYKKIPNWLIAFTAAEGVLWRFSREGAMAAVFYAGAAALVMCLLYFLFKLGAVGAGDVKLLGVTAGYLPFKKILVFLFLSLLIAAVVSLVKMVRKGYFLERLSYFFDYVKDVVNSGRFKLYLNNEQDRGEVGICLSGPVLASVLFYLGGIYCMSRGRR